MKCVSVDYPINTMAEYFGIFQRNYRGERDQCESCMCVMCTDSRNHSVTCKYFESTTSTTEAILRKIAYKSRAPMHSTYVIQHRLGRILVNLQNDGISRIDTGDWEDIDPADVKSLTFIRYSRPALILHSLANHDDAFIAKITARFNNVTVIIGDVYKGETPEIYQNAC